MVKNIFNLFLLLIFILSISLVFISASTLPSRCSAIIGECEEVYSKCWDLINEELNNKFAEIDTQYQPDYDRCIDEFGECSKASVEGQIAFGTCMTASDNCLESYRNKVALKKEPVQKEFDNQQSQLNEYIDGCNSPQLTNEILKSSATITNYEGDVQMYRPGQNVVPINRVQVLEQGDKIVTGSKGKVKIIFDDGSAVYVGPNSEFILETIAPLESTFKLDIGAIRAFIKKGLEKRTFKSRSIAATIRGTEFVLISDPVNEILEFNLYEGNVELTSENNEERKEISAGQTAIADAQGIRVSSLTKEKWDSLVNEITISERNSSKYFIIFFLLLVAV